MIEQIHQKALTATKNYKRCEIELIEILEQVDQNRVYLHYGYNSLFKYTTDALGRKSSTCPTFMSLSS